jgi:hypothetical protein
VSKPSGVTVSSQSWTWTTADSNAAVGGYVTCPPPAPATNPSSGSIVPLPNPNPFSATLCGQDASVRSSTVANIMFYWVTQGTRSVTYTYSLSNGVSGTATVTFLIKGPNLATNLDPTCSAGSGIICAHIGGIYAFSQAFVNNGNPVMYAIGVSAPDGTSVGILFKAQTNPSTSGGGAFSWTQLISYDRIRVVQPPTTASPNGVSTCYSFGSNTPSNPPVPPILDTMVPYQFVFNVNAPSDTAEDSPLSGLLASRGELSRNFTATMFLMWTPNLAGSIQVPLGSMMWQLNGDTINTLAPQPAPFPGTSGTTWTMNNCSSVSPQACIASSTPLLSYPTWSSVWTYTMFTCP